LNEVQYATMTKVLAAWKRLKQDSSVFDTWWVKPYEWFDPSCILWYVHIQICPMHVMRIYQKLS
jgi:hypothetical protein